MSYVPLDTLDLALASVLLLVNVLLSRWLDLGITRSLLVAAIRMTVQLLLIGLVLKGVFAIAAR